jgi:hypothetical protein
MANALRSLAGAIVCAPCLVFAQASTADKNAGVGDMLLRPSTITITGHFELAPGPTALDLALRSIEEQIDRKHAEDLARSPFEAVWKNPLWRVLPTDPGGTMNSPVGTLPERLAYLDDPFLTPFYLTRYARHLDRELVLAEKRRLWFFSR